MQTRTHACSNLPPAIFRHIAPGRALVFKALFWSEPQVWEPSLDGKWTIDELRV